MLSFEQVVAGRWSLTTKLQSIRYKWDAPVNEALCSILSSVPTSDQIAASWLPKTQRLQ